MNKQSREFALNKINERKNKPSEYAAGGAAKVRKGEATITGKQIKPTKK